MLIYPLKSKEYNDEAMVMLQDFFQIALFYKSIFEKQIIYARRSYGSNYKSINVSIRIQ
jgi:hypothetical protein